MALVSSFDGPSFCLILDDAERSLRAFVTSSFLLTSAYFAVISSTDVRRSLTACMYDSRTCATSALNCFFMSWNCPR